MVGNRAGPHTKSVVYRHNEVNINMAILPPPPPPPKKKKKKKKSGYSLVSHTLRVWSHETMVDGAAQGLFLKSIDFLQIDCYKRDS